MVQKEESALQILLQGIVGLFAILMIGVFPLFYQDNYIDILRAKLLFFRVSAFGLLGVVSVLSTVGWLQKKRKRTRKEDVPKERGNRWNLEFIFCGVFMLAILLSTVFSEYAKEAWLGTGGRRLGGEVLLLCVMVYCITAKFMRPDMGLIWILLISNSLVFLLGILNFWGVDVLHMYDDLAQYQHDYFLSTMGNINVSANYACLILPVVMVLYYLSETAYSRRVYGGFLILGFYETYLTLSDSWILGIGVSYLVLLWFSLKEHRQMKHFLSTCSLFFISSLLLRVTLWAGSVWEADSPMFLRFQELALQNRMTGVYGLLVMGILWAGSSIFLKYVEKNGKTIHFIQWRRIIFSLLGMVIVIGIVLFLLANSDSGRMWEGKAEWLNRLKLQDSFGSNRGYIWKRTLHAWCRLSTKQKIFGFGLNCFQQFIDTGYGEEIRLLYTAPFADAHNEMLQFLVTTGILGVTGYFGLLISAAVLYGKKASRFPILMMGTVTICSYLAQGMVNNPQIFTTPLLFLFLGIMKSMEKLCRKGKG